MTERKKWDSVHNSELTEQEAKITRYHHLITSLQDLIDVTKSYQLARNYAPLFSVILEVLSTRYPNIKSAQSLVELMTDPDQEAENVARKVLEASPFQEFSVLEIGGPFAQLLHGLGAEAYCIDPDINSNAEWWNEEKWVYTPRTRSEGYHGVPLRLNAENWQHVLQGKQFDLTFSRWVLCSGSGTSGNWRRKAKRLAQLGYYNAYSDLQREAEPVERRIREELFTIAGHATKPEGSVIHEAEYLNLQQVLPLASSAGLELKEDRKGYSYWGLPVLRTVVLQKVK